MIIGILMLLVPTAVFLGTLPLSRRLKPRLRQLYRIVGGTVVIAGSGTSLYFAAYSGDQGGIAAFFFQTAVIVCYALFSLVVIITNGLMRSLERRRYGR